MSCVSVYLSDGVCVYGSCICSVAAVGVKRAVWIMLLLLPSTGSSVRGTLIEP